MTRDLRAGPGFMLGNGCSLAVSTSAACRRDAPVSRDAASSPRVQTAEHRPIASVVSPARDRIIVCGGIFDDERPARTRGSIGGGGMDQAAVVYGSSPRRDRERLHETSGGPGRQVDHPACLGICHFDRSFAMRARHDLQAPVLVVRSIEHEHHRQQVKIAVEKIREILVPVNRPRRAGVFHEELGVVELDVRRTEKPRDDVEDMGQTENLEEPGVIEDRVGDCVGDFPAIAGLGLELETIIGRIDALAACSTAATATLNFSSSDAPEGSVRQGNRAHCSDSPALA